MTRTKKAVQRTRLLTAHRKTKVVAETAMAYKKCNPADQSVVTVCCGSSQYIIHRNRLQIYSMKLRDLLADVGDEGYLHVQEDEEVFHEVLSFMQYDAYRAPFEDLLLHMRVYCMAKKYRVGGLVDRAYSSFVHGLQLVWNTPAMGDAIMEAYSAKGAFQLREPLHDAIDMRRAEFERSKADGCGDFWTALAACPQAQRDLEMRHEAREKAKAERAVRLVAKREKNPSEHIDHAAHPIDKGPRKLTKKQRKLTEKTRKLTEKARKLTEKAAKEGATKGTKKAARRAARKAAKHHQSASSGPNASRPVDTVEQGSAHSSANNINEPDSDYKGSGLEEDDDEIALSREDLDGVVADNVVERRTRGKTLGYTATGKAMNTEQYAQWLTGRSSAQKFARRVRAKNEERARMKH